jgi:hypothetical protein
MDFRYTLPLTEVYYSKPRCGVRGGEAEGSHARWRAAAEVSMRGRAAAAKEPSVEWRRRIPT